MEIEVAEWLLLCQRWHWPQRQRAQLDPRAMSGGGSANTSSLIMFAYPAESFLEPGWPRRPRRLNKQKSLQWQITLLVSSSDPMTSSLYRPSRPAVRDVNGRLFVIYNRLLGSNVTTNVAASSRVPCWAWVVGDISGQWKLTFRYTGEFQLRMRTDRQAIICLGVVLWRVGQQRPKRKFHKMKFSWL